jgi:MFS family permease
VGAAIRSNRPLRRLLGAWAQSCVGTGAGYVALLLLAYRHLHTPWAVTAVLLADFVPAIVLGSWFGALADRHSKGRLIVAASTVQGAAFIALAFARTGPAILGLALLAGVGNALQRPALRSALPLVAGEARQSAAAVYDACRWIGITAGPALAAALFAVSGVALPLALNGASFLVAAAVMMTVPIPAPAGGAPGEQVSAGVRAGLAAAFRAPGITAVVACSAASVIAGGLLNVSEPILATRVLHGSGSDYALLVACYGIGMVGASVLVVRRGEPSAGVLTRRYLAALSLTAGGMAVSAAVGSVAPAMLAFAVTGFANALLLVSETQLIQLRVPGAVQGRLFGGKDTAEGAALLIGLLAAAPLVAGPGVRFTLALGAAICLASAAAAALALRRPAIRRAAAAAAPTTPARGERPPISGLLEVEAETR